MEDITCISILEDSSQTYNSAFFAEVSYTIMYIDDNSIDTWLAEQILISSGVTDKLLTASNGIKGLQLVKEYFKINKVLPDIIIADLQMPLMDGFELIKSVRELPYYSENKTHLILISAGLDEEDILKIKDLKIRNILIKPFDRESFLKILP